MRGFIKQIAEDRFTLYQLILRDFKLKYTGSILGLSWAVINPVAIMLVVSFVFTEVFRVDFKNFPVFVLSAMFPWMWFSITLNESAFSLLTEAHLFKQFNVRKEFFVISSAAANLINFLLGWVLVLPVFFILQPGSILLVHILLFLVFAQFLFSLGLGFILASSNVILRDIGKLLEIVLLFWFWATPVFYSVDMIPDRWLWIIFANPMALFIKGYRSVLFGGIAPSVPDLTAIFLWSVCVLFIGFIYFRKLEPMVLKRI